MRKLTTSLSLLTLLAPASAWAQDPVTLDETNEDPASEEAEFDESTDNEADAGDDGVADTDLDVESGGTAVMDPAVGAPAPAPAPPAAQPPAAPPPPAAPAADEPAMNRPTTTRGGAADSSWGFSYSGYFRAPLRMGIGTNTSPAHRQDAIELAGSDVNPEGQVLVRDENGAWGGEVQKKQYSLHLPVIPDNQYPSWQFTSHNRSDWAEMFFTVGNSIVSGTLALQAFQYTDSTWELSAGQFGIGQGWIEVDHDLGLDNFNFNAKVGAHWARYGMAGIYDAGEYDTYLFGRTHTTGVTLRTDFILPSFDLGIEAGFGAKVPNPKVSNRARFTTMAHGHVFLTFPSIEFSAHAMHAWSTQEVVPQFGNVYFGSSGCNYQTAADGGGYGEQCTINDDQISPPDGTEFAGGPTGIEGDNSAWGPQYPMGSQTIFGADVRWDLGLLGYLYAGYSYQILKNALTVDSAIESVHAYGGGNFNIGATDNYLESPFCKVLQGDPDYITAPNDSCSNGTGSVGSALLQYELGLGNFGIFPGNMDLKLKLYGMLNHVSVDDIEEQRLADLYEESATYNFSPEVIKAMRQDGTIKYKFGADAEFFPLDFMSFGLRFDRLNPTNNAYLKNYQGFMILSPRIVFRTQMVTHEEFSIQYSRYFYDQRQCESRDAGGNVNRVASPADDPFRVGGEAARAGNSIYSGADTQSGLPLNLLCTQPPPGPRPPYGFGSHAVSQDAGNRGSPQLLPDENVIKIEASMWW